MKIGSQENLLLFYQHLLGSFVTGTADFFPALSVLQ
jgi:hypothetical protein